MRLSLAFVLSLALAQATEPNPSNIIRQRQVRRNDTDEPQRIKKAPRTTSTDKKDKKSKDTVVQSESSKRDKKKVEVTITESKKDKKSKNVVEGNSKKKSKDAVSQKEIKDALKEEKAKKKEKISVSQKDLKKKLDVVDVEESEFAPVALDLGDILSGGRTYVPGNTVDQKDEKDKVSKRQKKKEAKESAAAEALVEESSFQDIASVEQLDEPTFAIEGGRHKHVGHGRKKGRGKHGRGRGQKLQGEASGKSGKEDEFSRFRNKHHGGRRNGGKTKTKTRGYGKLRNSGSDMKDSSKKTSNKKTTVRMGARGSAYDGKARKML